MPVRRLRIHNFRNIPAADLRLSGGFNLFFGANGAGKSSVLEAVHVLGTGKSFRAASVRSMVRFGSDAFALSAEVDPGPHQLGVERGLSGPARVVVDRNRVGSASGLAERLPVLVISMNDFRLFEDGPKMRRAFVDWAVFHEAHEQAGMFARFQQSLKQRNRLLKNDTIDPSEKAVWDREFVQSSENLDVARERSVSALSEVFHTLLAELGLDELQGKLAWSVFPGWDRRKGSLEEQLAGPAVRERERLYKRSVIGPQRFELRFSVDGLPAEQVLSRGQMKVFAHLLKLAQIRVLSERRSKGYSDPVVLLDDIAAELDSRYLGGVLELLSRSENQVFLSAVTASQLPEIKSWAKESSVSMFHVEQGEIHE